MVNYLPNGEGGRVETFGCNFVFHGDRQYLGNFVPKYNHNCLNIKPLVERSIKIVKKNPYSRRIIRLAKLGTLIAISLSARLIGKKKTDIYMR